MISCYSFGTAAPYPVRPARPWPYLDFEKEKAAAAAAARRAGGAPEKVYETHPQPYKKGHKFTSDLKTKTNTFNDS